jgi:hypothetical protein
MWSVYTEIFCRDTNNFFFLINVQLDALEDTSVDWRTFDRTLTEFFIAQLHNYYSMSRAFFRVSLSVYWMTNYCNNG